MYGADVEELRRIAQAMTATADDLDEQAGFLTRLLGNVSWMGDAATRFVDRWTGVELPAIGLSTRFIRHAAEELVRQADEQERASSADALTNWQGGADSTVLGPHRGPDWWSKLSDSEREQLINGAPQDLMRDGVPPGERIAATRRYMEERRDWLRRTGADPSELARLEDWLGSDAAPTSRQFLFYDPADGGRVAEVFGDLTTADNIAVVVPGINNDITNFDGFRTDAEALHGGDPERATVAWLGYDTPDSNINPFANGDVLTTQRAREAAPALAGFVAGLQATTAGEITVSAHSYGTVVTTFAAEAGMTVDRVMLLGSPGVPADNASVFNGAEVYVMNNGSVDFVPYVDNVASAVIRSNPLLGGPLGSFVADSVLGDGSLMTANTDPGDPGFGATILDGNYRGHHGDYYRGEELDQMQRVVSPLPELRDGFDVSRSVDDQGRPVVTKKARF